MTWDNMTPTAVRLHDEQDVSALHRAIVGHRRSGAAELHSFLIDALRGGRLFALSETDVDVCLCAVAADDPRTAELIWVHPRWRRRGFAGHLVRSLGIKTARHILPGAASHFWDAVGVDVGRPATRRRCRRAPDAICHGR